MSRSSQPPFPTSSTPTRRDLPPVAAKVVFGYVVFASLWILLSDLAVSKLVASPGARELLSMAKGWFFVAFTAALLYTVLRRHELQCARESARRDESERALHALNSQVRWLGDNLPGAYLYQYSRDAEGRPHFHYVGAQAEHIHLLTPVEIVRDGNLIWDQVVPEQRQALLDLETDTYRDLRDINCECRIQRADGEYRWLRLRARPRRQADGQVLVEGLIIDVTEQRRSEQSLRESEERWRSLVNLMPDAVFIHQGDRIVFANQRAAGLFRAELPDDLVGLTIPELADPESHEKIRLGAEALLRGETVPPMESIVRRFDGVMIPVETTAAMVLFGKVPSIQVVMRDVSERQKVEQKLRAHESVLEETGRIAKVGGWSFDPISGEGYWTAEVARIYDLSPTDPTSREVGLRYYTPESRTRIEAAIRTAIEQGTSYDLELELVTVAGRHKWVRTIGHPVIESGKVVRLRGSFQDITERRLQDEERERQQRRITLLADISRRLVIAEGPEGLLEEIFSDIARELGIEIFANYMVDAAGDGLVLMNSGGLSPAQEKDFARLEFGQSLCGVVAQSRKRAVYANLPTVTEPQAAGIIALGVKAYAGLPMIAGDRLIGTISFGTLTRDRFSEDDVRLMKAVADQVAAAMDRRRLMLALREGEERFREVVENIQEVFWLTDALKREVIYISPAFETVWGRSCASLRDSLGVWRESIHTEDRVRVMQAAQTQQVAGTYNETYRIVRPDGSVRWVRDRAFPVRDADGAVTRLVGVATDVTQERELEARLLRSQRLEAVGTLAGGIAHDLNNILAPVLMIAGLLKDHVLAPSDQKMLDMLESSAKRGAGIIRQLLAFSRGASGEKGVVQLRHLAKEMIALMRETFPRQITISDQLAPDLRPIMGDGTQLHQVLMNLCVNARDAMPDGGKLSLRATNVELTAADVDLHTGMAPGSYIRVTVQDTGHGIPPDVLPRIFDPFFTTKELGKGTGLGLSTVNGIVKSHQGFLAVESTVGSGTSFHVYFPAAECAAAALLPDAHSPLARGRGELVLVVDDEASVATATRLLLEDHNYRVLVAQNGREALSRFLVNQDSIRLVLTDLMMPVMGGVALARALKGLKPDLPIVATTGLEQRDSQAELRQLGVTEMLAKPCLPAELLGTVRRVLGDG